MFDPRAAAGRGANCVWSDPMAGGAAASGGASGCDEDEDVPVNPPAPQSNAVSGGTAGETAAPSGASCRSQRSPCFLLLFLLLVSKTQWHFRQQNPPKTGSGFTKYQQLGVAHRSFRRSSMVPRRAFAWKQALSRSPANREQTTAEPNRVEPKWLRTYTHAHRCTHTHTHMIAYAMCRRALSVVKYNTWAGREALCVVNYNTSAVREALSVVKWNDFDGCGNLSPVAHWSNSKAWSEALQAGRQRAKPHKSDVVPAGFIGISPRHLWTGLEAKAPDLGDEAPGHLNVVVWISVWKVLPRPIFRIIRQIGISTSAQRGAMLSLSPPLCRPVLQ